MKSISKHQASTTLQIILYENLMKVRAFYEKCSKNYLLCTDNVRVDLAAKIGTTPMYVGVELK